MLLYILAGIGALTVAIVLLALLLMFFNWLGQPVTYLVPSNEIPRYLAAWGYAIAEGGRIQVSEPRTDRSVILIKRHYRKTGERLVFRFRNADTGRQHFEKIESALSSARIAFEVERTPTRRPRAIVIPFPIDDPLMLSAAAHTVRVTLVAMGASQDGPFEMRCTGSHRPDYVRGAGEVIPWTRGYRAGFHLGQLAIRLWRRS